MARSGMVDRRQRGIDVGYLKRCDMGIYGQQERESCFKISRDSNVDIDVKDAV